MREVDRVFHMIANVDLEGLSEYAEVDRPKVGRKTRQSLYCLFNLSLSVAKWKDRSEERMTEIIGGTDDTRRIRGSPRQLDQVDGCE